MTGSIYDIKNYRPITISVSWSYLLNDYNYPDEPKQLQFPDKVMPYIDKAAEKFRETRPETIDLIGIVSILRRESLNEIGTISLHTKIDDQSRVVRIELPPEIYKTAIDAHKSGAVFRVTGELMKRNHFYYLENPRNVDLI